MIKAQTRKAPTKSPTESRDKDGNRVYRNEVDFDFPELEKFKVYVERIKPHLEQIYDMVALDGKGIMEVWSDLGIRYDTIMRYKKASPRFAEFLKMSTSKPNLQLKVSLFQHSIGYFVEEISEEWLEDAEGNLIAGSVKKVTRKKRWIPANPTLQIFMAKARYPEQFQEQNIIGAMLDAPKIVVDIDDSQDE